MNEQNQHTNQEEVNKSINNIWLYIRNLFVIEEVDFVQATKKH